MFDPPPQILLDVRQVIASAGPAGSLAQAKAVLDAIEAYIVAREAEARRIEADAALVLIQSREASARLSTQAAAVQACAEIARKKTMRGALRHADVALECADAIRDLEL